MLVSSIVALDEFQLQLFGIVRILVCKIGVFYFPGIYGLHIQFRMLLHVVPYGKKEQRNGGDSLLSVNDDKLLTAAIIFRHVDNRTEKVRLVLPLIYFLQIL